jgi:hypothetical protein
LKSSCDPRKRYLAKANPLIAERKIDGTTTPIATMMLLTKNRSKLPCVHAVE